ncbi:MAG: sulfatase-like hydrolase/transferase [Phycisphaerales bacterium]|nr:sulfatase-like hydrolase/transferase [Phycisphaerales bacterium]
MQGKDRSNLNRPNFLLIMTDQHRHDFVGYAGSTFVSTPNIDRIATEGTAFSQSYTNAPICAPARCALATGCQPHRIGVLDNSRRLITTVPDHLFTFARQ